MLGCLRQNLCGLLRFDKFSHAFNTFKVLGNQIIIRNDDCELIFDIGHQIQNAQRIDNAAAQKRLGIVKIRLLVGEWKSALDKVTKLDFQR